MVKKGGMKRKIEIKPIKTKTSLGPTCNKRREGLFSKASQLCLLSDAQVAVLATPSSSESNVSFYSFGHSSVDGVVSAFLSGQRPVPVPNPEDDKVMREDVGICLTRNNLGLGFWWNNDRLIKSEDPREINDAIDSMWTLLGNLKGLRADEASFVQNNQAFVNDHEDLKNNEKCDFILDGATQEPGQTLNHLQSISPIICCIPPPPDAIDDQSTCPDDDYLIADTVFTHDYLPADINDITEEQDQILCVKNNNNNVDSFTEVNLDFDDQELDIDQLIDFDTNFESSLDNWYTHQEIGLNLDQCFPYIS